MKKTNNHPGLFLKDLYINKLGLSIQMIAWKLDVPKATMEKVFSGKQCISIDLALRLAKCFKTDVYYYISIQMKYDFQLAESKCNLKRVRSIYDKEQPVGK